LIAYRVAVMRRLAEDRPLAVGTTDRGNEMFDERGGDGSKFARHSAPAALGADAVAWMHTLPPHVRPLQTAARFPHIVNALSGAWATPTRCRGCFDQLLIDQRGDRQGFPNAVASELAALKDFYDSVVHPTQQTVWDEIAGNARR
jgi:hypothetical protein